MSNKEIEAVTLVERVKYDESGTDLEVDRCVRYKKGELKLNDGGVDRKGKDSRICDLHKGSPLNSPLLTK